MWSTLLSKSQFWAKIFSPAWDLWETAEIMYESPTHISEKEQERRGIYPPIPVWHWARARLYALTSVTPGLPWRRKPAPIARENHQSKCQVLEAEKHQCSCVEMRSAEDIQRGHWQHLLYLERLKFPMQKIEKITFTLSNLGTIKI